VVTPPCVQEKMNDAKSDASKSTNLKT